MCLQSMIQCHGCACMSSVKFLTGTRGLLPLTAARRVPEQSCAGLSHLLQGRSGVSPIEGFAVDGWATRIAAEIKDFQCQGFVSKKMERRLDKCIKYTMVSGKKVRCALDVLHAAVDCVAQQ